MDDRDDLHGRLSTRRTARQAHDNGQDSITSEDIVVRNYDQQWGYDLSLEVTETNGEIAFEKHYYLQAGQVESELNALSPGKYVIEATLDNLTTDTLQCQIDATPKHTAVIEIGNGALSLTEGIHT